MPNAFSPFNRINLEDIPQRMPYSSENAFFKKYPNVTGMATDDNQVILNPHSTINEKEKDSVLKNERIRVLMKMYGAPNFYITPEQQSSFNGYGSQNDIASTIAARIFSGDPSAGTTTNEQTEWIKNFLGIGNKK
jgi:hypothetical protein